MRTILCVSVGIIVDISDDSACVGSPLPHRPLDELAVCLRGGPPDNRQQRRRGFIMPGVNARMANAFARCPERN